MKLLCKLVVMEITYFFNSIVSWGLEKTKEGKSEGHVLYYTNLGQGQSWQLLWFSGGSRISERGVLKWSAREHTKDFGMPYPLLIM